MDPASLALTGTASCLRRGFLADLDWVGLELELLGLMDLADLTLVELLWVCWVVFLVGLAELVAGPALGFESGGMGLFMIRWRWRIRVCFGFLELSGGWYDRTPNTLKKGKSSSTEA